MALTIIPDNKRTAKILLFFGLTNSCELFFYGIQIKQKYCPRRIVFLRKYSCLPVVHLAQKAQNAYFSKLVTFESEKRFLSCGFRYISRKQHHLLIKITVGTTAYFIPNMVVLLKKGFVDHRVPIHYGFLSVFICSVRIPPQLTDWHIIYQ